MKNKILQLSKGDFQSIKSDIEIDETNLVFIVGEGEVYRESFSLRTDADRMIRGFVYTSSEKIRFKNKGFEGNPAVIEFAFDGRGLEPGHVEKGQITVVSDAGEYDLSFTAIIERPYLMTNYGKIQSTSDFRKLAIKDYNEASKLFRSRAFYEILKYENDRIFYLYDNMRKWELGDQAMEEFLVGIKQKERIFLTLSSEEKLYHNLEESKSGKIRLTKNTWGYMPVQVNIDGTFIKISTDSFTTDDFTSDVYDFEYKIDIEGLHKGRNFGAIHFVTPYATLTCKIEVVEDMESNRNHSFMMATRAQLMHDYLDYLSGKIDISSWLTSAIEKMNQLLKVEPKNDYYQLVRANIYLLGQRKEDARSVLENYNFGKFTSIRNPINNAYYSFLNAWIKGSTSHMERALDDIYKALSLYPDSWLLLSMVLTMDARLKSPYRKIELLEEYYEYGTCEVLFYYEVFKCYKEKASLLRNFGKLEKEVLNFASKYNLLTREMALQVASIANQQKSYDVLIFRILVRLYKQYEDPAILNSICTFLIKGNKIGTEYFIWYKKAVDKDLKIAQLYEYYMYSIDDNKYTELLPKKILYYFMHGNRLHYKKKAVLYANVALFKDEIADLYSGYEKQIIDFTWEQLLKRHITEALKVLYKQFCDESDFTAERMEALRDICYSYRITTEADNINLVLVIENNGEIGQKVRYDEEFGAVVRLYNNESRIVWESVDGHYYTDSIVFKTERLFFEPKFIRVCELYERSLLASDEELKRTPSFEGIKEFGLKAFRLDEVLDFCSEKIIENQYHEDALLVNLAYKLFDRDFYNNETLAYLAEYYCGPTVNMKRIWAVLDEKNLPKLKLSESIITQAVFAEHMINDEKIFKDYYHSDSVYEQLILAYLAYISREYILYEKDLDPAVFEIILDVFKNQNEMPDVCKMAVLKYYSEHSFNSEFAKLLHNMMRELCEKGLVFPFFMNYEDEWLKELLIYDKSMILYKANPGSKVNLFYKMECEEGESLGYHSETMNPIFENIYVKQFVLFDDESIKYYIQEFSKKSTISTEKRILSANRLINSAGKYERINQMIDMSDEQKTESMIHYAVEEILAEEIFKTY